MLRCAPHLSLSSLSFSFYSCSWAGISGWKLLDPALLNLLHCLCRMPGMEVNKGYTVKLCSCDMWLSLPSVKWGKGALFSSWDETIDCRRVSGSCVDTERERARKEKRGGERVRKRAAKWGEVREEWRVEGGCRSAVFLRLNLRSLQQHSLGRSHWLTRTPPSSVVGAFFLLFLSLIICLSIPLISVYRHCLCQRGSTSVSGVTQCRQPLPSPPRPRRPCVATMEISWWSNHGRRANGDYLHSSHLPPHSFNTPPPCSSSSSTSPFDSAPTTSFLSKMDTKMAVAVVMALIWAFGIVRGIW